MSTPIPRTHYRFFGVAGALLVGAGLLVTLQDRPGASPETPTASATDAVPADALLVVAADLARLRESGLAEKLRAESRDVPGLGDLREACGFDPLESFDGAAFAIPGGGADGDFGISALGTKVTGEQLLACTTKVIEARGGKPLASTLGSFQTVRDVATGAPAGEIAARPGGPFLLGAGSYLRAMVDAADGRVPSVEGDGAHARLAAALAGAPLVTATLVLGRRQRATIADEIARAGASAPPAIGKIAAAAIGLEAQGERVGLHAILACDDGRAAIDVANAIDDVRARRADGPLAPSPVVAALLTAVHVEVERDLVHARLVIARQDAETLVGYLLAAGPPAGRGREPAAALEPVAPLPSASTAASASSSASAVPSASAGPPASAGPAPKKKKPKPTKPTPSELEEF